MKHLNVLKGKPQYLGVLDYGLFQVHANGRIIGICGFVLRTDADEVVVIDTGFPAKYAHDIVASALEDRLGGFGTVLRLGPDNLPHAQLASLGIAPEDVTLFITSHTHIDHVGDLAAFPQAPLLMSRAERALSKPLYWGDVRPLEWPDREYLLVDEDSEIGPGFRVMLAPGHSPGQLAFLVTLPETGPVLLTSYAISRPAEIEERFVGSADPDLALSSAQRLMQIANETGAFVIYGHSPEQWNDLRKVPETYR